MRRVEFAEGALRDLGLILDYLAAAYREFGETPGEAAEHAGRRVRAIIATADRLALAPHRGPVHDDIAPGLRHVTLDRAIYYFQIAGEEGECIRVLAIFLSGQDHERRMRGRLLRGGN